MMITIRYAGKEDGDEKETKKLKLTGAATIIPVKVYAQDFKTVTSYEIVVTRDYSGLNLKDNLVKGFAFDESTDGAVDEVLLFNRALSSAEVSAVAGKVVTTKTLGISGDAGNKETSPTVKPDDENKEPSGNPAQTKKVTVKAAGYTLKNNTITLVTNAKSFTTSKKTVATVSSNGVVTAKKVGSAKITLKYGSSSKAITVKVVKKAKKKG